MRNNSVYDFRFSMHLALKNSQGGVVLLVAMIMVLVIAVVGLAAIRGSGLQEMMAGNLRDRNLAFQAAEAGLRSAENTIRSDIALSELPSFDGNGHFDDLNKTGGDREPPSLWSDDVWKANGSAVLTAMSLELASGEQPRYVMEKLVVPVTLAAAADGSAIDIASLDTFEEPEFYRISSRGTGGTVNANVTLQSVYKR